MNKRECTKCNNWFSSNNFAKHFSTCSGSYTPFRKRTSCAHCDLTFDNLSSTERASHTRWCERNPKRKDYVESLKSARSYITPESTKKRAESIKEAHAKGCYDHIVNTWSKGRKHTPEAIEKIKAAAQSSGHRRLRKGTVMYKGVLLDSSWELALAERLDFLNVIWSRPDPIVWVDTTGVNHHYFADFYLPEYGLLLDPKNPAAVKAQHDKLTVLKKLLPNLIILQTLEEIKCFEPNFYCLQLTCPAVHKIV